MEKLTSNSKSKGIFGSDTGVAFVSATTSASEVSNDFALRPSERFIVAFFCCISVEDVNFLTGTRLRGGISEKGDDRRSMIKLEMVRAQPSHARAMVTKVTNWFVTLLLLSWLPKKVQFSNVSRTSNTL